MGLQSRHMNPRLALLQTTTRRTFLQSSSLGLGGIALSSLVKDARADVPVKPDNPLAPKKPHFAGAAKRVIYLHMSGAPPHLDIFDYKPELQKHDGKPCPECIVAFDSVLDAEKMSMDASYQLSVLMVRYTIPKLTPKE